MEEHELLIIAPSILTLGLFEMQEENAKFD